MGRGQEEGWGRVVGGWTGRGGCKNLCVKNESGRYQFEGGRGGLV